MPRNLKRRALIAASGMGLAALIMTFASTSVIPIPAEAAAKPVSKNYADVLYAGRYPSYVVYNDRAAPWHIDSTQLDGEGGGQSAELVFQRDCNFVLYGFNTDRYGNRLHGTAKVYWASNTVRSTRCKVVWQGDGNIVIINAGQVIRSLNTNAGAGDYLMQLSRDLQHHVCLDVFKLRPGGWPANQLHYGSPVCN